MQKRAGSTSSCSQMSSGILTSRRHIVRTGTAQVHGGAQCAQFQRQSLPCGALTRWLCLRLAAQFLIDGRQVHVDGFGQQQALFTHQRLAHFGEAHAFVIGKTVYLACKVPMAIIFPGASAPSADVCGRGSGPQELLFTLRTYATSFRNSIL